MELTKEQKEQIAQATKASIIKEIQEENKGAMAQLKETTDLMVEKFDKLNEGRGSGYHSGISNAPRHGVASTVEDPDTLRFQDKDGKIHEAISVKKSLFKGSTEDFSVGNIIRAKILGDFKGLSDIEKKAIGEGIGAGGGFLISEDVAARMIDLARNKSCVMEAGALTIQMASPELRLVRLTGDPTAYWVAEHGQITESDWTLAPINLKAMTIGVLVRSSLELLEDAENAGQQIENSMSAALSLAIDKVALLGDGVNEPRGLDLCSDVNVIDKGTNGATITNYDDFSNAVEDVADANGQAGAVIYAPRTHYTLDRLKAATTNQPLVPPQSFIDLKKFVTNQIGITDTHGTATNASKAFVGDFKNVLYGIRKQLEVEATRQGGTNTFAKCEMLIRCRMRLDLAVTRENHFTRISGIII